MHGSIIMSGRIACALGIVLLSPLTALAADVVVKVMEVTEIRQEKLIKPDDDMFMSGQCEPGLTLKLELSGAAAGQATHWGMVSLKEATDDSGKKLTVRTDTFDNLTEEYSEINREMMFFGREEAGKDKLELELPLTLPARKAGALKAVTGELKLRVGKPAEVLVKDPQSLAGKELDDATLAKADLKIKVLGKDQFGTDAGSAVFLQVGGTRDALLDCALLDGSGEELMVGVMTMGGTNHDSVTIDASDKLPKGVVLRLTVAEGLTEQSVKLELRDVPLP